MASFASIPHSQSFLNKPTWESPQSTAPRTSFLFLSLSSIANPSFLCSTNLMAKRAQSPLMAQPRAAVVSAASAAAATAEKPKKPNEKRGFVEEMRQVAVKLHTRDQAKGGEREAPPAPAKWEPSIEGYLRFLVDSKLVYDTLEEIVEKASYSELRNTGLERSESLAKDLEWFKEQGHSIPEPSSPGVSYSLYLKELSEKDSQAFLCHYYNFYFAHTAGGRIIGKKVAEMILNSKELEFYKWDGNLSEMLRSVKEKLNKVAEGWTREEKDHCLEETEKSFKYSGDILRLIVS